MQITNNRPFCSCAIEQNGRLTNVRYNRYGYHMPRTHARDNYYTKLEQQKAEKRGAQA